MSVTTRKYGGSLPALNTLFNFSPFSSSGPDNSSSSSSADQRLRRQQSNAVDKRGVRQSTSFDLRAKMPEVPKTENVRTAATTAKVNKSTTRRILGGQPWHRSSMVQEEDVREVQPGSHHRRSDLRDKEFFGTYLAPVPEAESTVGRVYHLTQEDFCPIKAPPPFIEDTSRLCESETVVVSLSETTYEDLIDKMTTQNNTRNVELREMADLEILAPRRPIALVQPQQKQSAILLHADLKNSGSLESKQSSNIITPGNIDVNRDNSFDRYKIPLDISEKIDLSKTGSWEDKRKQSKDTPDDVGRMTDVSKNSRSQSLEALLSPNPLRTTQIVRFVYYDDAEDSMPVNSGAPKLVNIPETTAAGNYSGVHSTPQDSVEPVLHPITPRNSSVVNKSVEIFSTKPVQKSFSNNEHSKVSYNRPPCHLASSMGDLTALSKIQLGSDPSFPSPSGSKYAARHSEYNWQFRCPPPKITSNFATLRTDEIPATETETLKMRNQAKADKKDAEIATELNNLNIDIEAETSVQDLMCSQRSLYSEQLLGYFP